MGPTENLKYNEVYSAAWNTVWINDDKIMKMRLNREYVVGTRFERTGTNGYNIC